MGADILKVELPGDGDPERSIGRPPDGFSTYFEALNRGKRSIALDLRLPEAQAVVRKLVPQVDVLAENFRPGVMDGFGLGYAQVVESNPRLIYAVNSGFGPEGEWRDRGSFVHVSQGMSGAMIARAAGPEPSRWS